MVVLKKGEQMAHKITEECVACGSCIPECPVEAISEGDPIYIIDAELCTDCGDCVEVCPSEAIIEE
jgi:ferredoxin